MTIGRATIAQTATATAVGFTLIGLVTTVLFLLINAILFAGTIKNFPIPDLKSVIIKDLENGPALISAEIEFPGSDKGNFISAQTEGPLEVSVFISESGKEFSVNPSLLVKLPIFELNLASKKPTKILINDLSISFNQEFDAGILSKIVESVVDKTFSLHSLPNIEVRIKSRVVLKSLWIPLGLSVDNYPFKIDSSRIMKKKAEEMNSVAVPSNKIPLDSKPIGILSLREQKKEKILKEFDFKPRSVRVMASDNEKFEIKAIVAVPAILVPEFLTLEVPEINVQAAFYKLNDQKPTDFSKFIQFSTKPFLVESAPSEDLKKELLIEFSILMDADDAINTQKLLKMARDNLKNEIGIQLKQGDKFLKNKLAGGLMFWLRNFILNVPVGKILAEKEISDAELKKQQLLDSNKNKITEIKVENLTEKEEDRKSEIINKEKVKLVKNQIVSIKLIKAVKVQGGGTFQVQIRILHSIVKFLVGKFPEISLDAKLIRDSPFVTDDRLIGLKISSSEITETSDKIDILIDLTLKNLKDLVYTGFRVGNLGTEKMHEIIPEIAKIKGVQVLGTSDNIISKLASVFSVEVLFGAKGIESVHFIDSPVQLYPASESNTPKTQLLPAESGTKQESSSPQQNSLSKDAKKKLDVAAMFAIENLEEDLKISASIDLAELPYFGDYVHLGWSEFKLEMRYNLKPLLNFKLHQGSFNVGITGGIKPFIGAFGTEITIPAGMNDLKDLAEFLKAFSGSEDQLFNFEFRIYYGNSKNDEIVLGATIPCKKLVLPEPVKIPQSDDIAKIIEEIQENQENPKSPPRTDFIGKVKNSVLSFVSFQSPTLFFHVAYPNQVYCPNGAGEDFDLKINLKLFLPTIEANLCAKESSEGDLKCFASAGSTRPMALTVDIIDDQICHVESKILNADTVIQGSDKIKESTQINFENNEIPIHFSIRDITALVRFAEMAGGKRQQFLTLGPVNDATNLNKFIGVIISSIFSIEIPEKQVLAPVSKIVDEAKILKEAAEKTKQNKDSFKRYLNIPFQPNLPAVLEISAKSDKINELELLAGFRLPPNALDGIQTVVTPDLMFNWPVLQWGVFDYTIGVKGIFEASITSKRGQIDLKDDGIVLSALNDFAIRFKLSTDENFPLGSTGLRQFIGTLMNYFKTSVAFRPSFDKKFIAHNEKSKLYYNFRMSGPRGLNDPKIFFANGEIFLKEILALVDAVIHRAPLPPLTEEQKQEEKVQPSPEDQSDPFEHVKITMKTIPKINQPELYIPCLVPALCKDSLSVDDEVVQTSPVDLIFELKNVLLPVTALVGSKLGPVLEIFKMSQYPSHLEFRFTSFSEIWLTVLLNGAGVVSLGLAPVEFSRKAIITYNSANTMILRDSDPNQISSVDNFEVSIKVHFPKTLIGIRSALSIIRRELLLGTPVPPAIYDLNKKIVYLSNPCFYFALSSDNRVSSRGNNLLSALIAAAMPEQKASGINPTDEQLNFIKNAAVDNVNAEKNTEGLGMVQIISSGISIAACLTTGLKCDDEIDLNYNMKLDFPVKALKFILPSTSIFRLFLDGIPVVRFIADSRRQRHLQISSLTGINVLGTANICLNGLERAQYGNRNIENISKYFLEDKDKTKLVPIEFQLVLGHDIKFKANLFFPLHKLRSFLVKKFTPKTLKNIFSLFSNSAAGSKVSTISLGPESESERRLFEFQLKESEIPEERIECLRISNDAKEKRLSEIDYSNTAIFYEIGNEIIKPNANTRIFLQLRTRSDEVVCGQPSETSDFKLKLIRHESQQGFIKLIQIFSQKAPKEKIEIIFTPKFNHVLNLFEVDIDLPYTGRYTVTLTYAHKEQIIPDSIIYVKNDY